MKPTSVAKIIDELDPKAADYYTRHDLTWPDVIRALNAYAEAQIKKEDSWFHDRQIN